MSWWGPMVGAASSHVLGSQVEGPSSYQGWNVIKSPPILNKNPKGSPITKDPNRTSWERVINFDTCSTLTSKDSAEPTKISKRTQKKTNDKDRAFAKWFKAPKHHALKENYCVSSLKIFKHHIGSPWRKFRIEIHFESILTIPSHSGIWFQTKPSYSEFSIRINPKPIQNQSEISIRINPVNFGFIRIHSDWKFGLIRIGRIHSD